MQITFEPFDINNIPVPPEEQRIYINGKHPFIVSKCVNGICGTGRPKMDVALKVEAQEGMAYVFKSFNFPLPTDNHKARFMMRTELKTFADCIGLPNDIFLQGKISEENVLGATGYAFFTKEAWTSEKTGKSGFSNAVTAWVTSQTAVANQSTEVTAAPEPAKFDDMPF